VSDSRPVLVEPAGDDGVVVVTLNRPDAYNATNQELHEAVTQVWPEVEGLPGARAVVLTGAGKAFSAGGDFGLLQRMVDDPALRKEVMDEAGLLVRRMVAFPLPVVAAVNGPAVGLGCSLPGLCDLVVMSEEAYFMDPHVGLGLVAGDGGALTWPLTMGPARAKEWLLLGGKMAPQEALALGLVNRVVPADQVLPEARALAARLAALPPQSLLETRKAIDRGLVERVEAGLDDLLAAETRSFDEPRFQENLAAARAKQKR
jgi:enoyl-CoA hydratase